MQLFRIHHVFKKSIGTSITSVAVVAMIASLNSASAAPNPTVSIEGENLSGALTTASDTAASGGKYATIGQTTGSTSTTTPPTTTPPTTAPPATNGSGPGTTSVSALPTAAKALTTYLEPGVLPPTNKWFSALAFDQTNLQNVFAYPLAQGTTATGFGLSYPKIVSSADSVFGSYTKQLNIDFGQAAVHTVAGYDDLSVRVDYRNSSQLLATQTLIQGSPFTFTKLSSGVTAKVTGDGATISSLGNNTFAVNTQGRTYVVAAGSGATISTLTNGVSVTATSNNALLSIGVVAEGGTASQYASLALNEVTSTSVAFAKSGTTFTTKYQLTTANGGKTLFATTPEFTNSAAGYGTYQTLNGAQPVVLGNSFTGYTTANTPDVALNLSGLTSAQKASLTATVQKDTASLTFPDDDTYFGFKELQRAAELLDIASQIGDSADANAIKAKLKTELSTWLDLSHTDGRGSKYFTYDTNYKGIVGQRASFGSDEFNDHIFHYGYLFNAAAIYSRYDSSFVSTYGANLNLIAQDVMNTNRASTSFTYVRPFDFYTGHAWASGTSPFADGNNQESSSEAVNGWYGLYRWAVASNNTTQATTALYLYNREANSALDNYLNFDQSQSMYSSFGHSVVSLLWGGKKDAATWFSPAAAAKLGIQLIPMSPGQSYVGVDTTRIAKNLTGVTGDGTFDAYLAMYRNFADPSGAQSALNALTDAQIDNALTRSYVQAYLWAPKSTSSAKASVETNIPMLNAAATSQTTFHDDFNGTGLPDASRWTIDTGTGYPGGPQNGFGTDEIETVTNSTANINQSGGKLYITPLRDGNGAWTSGRIETNDIFKPNSGNVMHIESSLALPNVHGAAAAGYWPAFWSMGETQRANRWLWPANGEFDFMESVNGINKNWSTLHCGYAAQWGGPCNEPNGISNAGVAVGGADIWGGFHTYAFEWDRSRGTGNDQLRWYVDNNVVHTVNQTDPAVKDVWATMTEHNGYFVLLNVAMGGQFPANQGGGPTAATTSGVPMIVDYVDVSYRTGSTTTTTTAAPTTTTTAKPTTTTAQPTTTTTTPAKTCVSQAQSTVDVSAGSYQTWVRVRGTAGQQVDVGNGTLCTTITVPSATWSWVPVSTNTITAGTRTFTIGVKSGSVQVDRILSTQLTSCTPSGTSDNCVQTATTSTTTKPTTTTTKPTSTTVASGGTSSAPTSLRATSVSSNSITLGWTAPSGGTAPITYKLLRAGIAIGSTLTGTSATDGGLAANTPYIYSIQATDATGKTATSGQISVTTLAAGATPTTVTTVKPTTTTTKPTTTTTAKPSVPATPYGLVAVSVTRSAITLNWAPISGATGYQILRAGIPIATSTTPQFTDNGLMPNTPYIYSVKALNTNGSSAATAQLTVTTAS